MLSIVQTQKHSSWFFLFVIIACLIIILFLLNEFFFIIYNSLLPAEEGRVIAKVALWLLRARWV